MKRNTKIIISLIVIFCLSLVTLNIISKSMLIDTISNSFTKKRVVANVLTKIRSVEDIDMKTVHNINRELANSSEIDKISELYLQNILKNIVDENYTNKKVDISKNFERMINSSSYLSDTQKKNIVKSSNETNYDFMYAMGLSLVKDSIPEKNYIFLKIYNVFSNVVLQIFALIIALILLIIIWLKNTKYEAFKLYSAIALSSSVILLIIDLIVKSKVTSIFSNMNEFTIDISIMNIFNIIYFTTSIVLIVITMLLKKKEVKN